MVAMRTRKLFDPRSRSIAPWFMAALLAACGGGGGGGSSSPAPQANRPPVFSSPATASVNENTAGTIYVPVTHLKPPTKSTVLKSVGRGVCKKITHNKMRIIN